MKQESWTRQKIQTHKYPPKATLPLFTTLWNCNSLLLSYFDYIIYLIFTFHECSWWMEQSFDTHQEIEMKHLVSVLVLVKVIKGFFAFFLYFL